MNFKNMYVVLFIMLLPIGMLACQPGGKFYGNCVRKLSKKDLHIGPNRNQQHRHDEWELLKAKKAQKAAGSTVRHELTSYVSLAKMLDQIRPTIYDRGAQYSLSARAYSNYSVKAVILFGLLLLQPAAGITRDNFDSDDYNFGFADCDSHQSMINFNRPLFEISIDTAHKLSGKIGEINFPAIPDIWCPDFGERYHRAAKLGDRTRENIIKARQFMRDFLSAEKELNRRINDYNARSNEESRHAFAVDECSSYAKLVTDQREVFDQCRHDAQTLQDKLGQLVVYPETPQIVCPSMENWKSWTVEEAVATTQKAKTFLNAFNQKVDEFNKLIDEFNRHRNATDTCQEFANLVTQQNPYLADIRQDALIINNQLGKLILFPDAPEITCPSMENWSEWPIERAEAMSQIAQTFLESLNQKIAELNELIGEYNKRMQQGETKVNPFVKTIFFQS